MTSGILQFIIRAKDEASAVIATVRGRLLSARTESSLRKDDARAGNLASMAMREGKDAAALAEATSKVAAAQKAGRAAIEEMNAGLSRQAAAAPLASKGLKGLGDTFEGMSDQFQKGASQVSRAMGVIGLVAAVAIAAWNFGKKVGQSIREMWDPVARLAASQPALERFNEFLAKSVAARRELAQGNMTKIADEYGAMADNLARAVTEQEKLNAARAQLAGARKDSAITSVDLAERQAMLAAGGDPVKQAAAAAAADAARRDIETRAAIEAATAAETAAVERDRLAQERLRLMASQRDDFQNEANRAETELASVRERMRLLNERLLAPDDRTAEDQKLQIDYAAAKAAADVARRALGKSIAPEATAASEARATSIEADAARAAADAARQRTDLDALDKRLGAARVADLAKREADDRAKADAALTAQRKRDLDDLAREDLRLRLDNVRAEVDASRALEGSARDRLGRAQAASAQTWSWYKDPSSWQAQLAGERQDAEAQKRFEGDSARLQGRFNWRTTKLGDQEEVVRRVIFAREEEQSARAALVQIEINTRGVAEKLDALLRLNG